MRIKRALILPVLAVALLGCGKREPRHVVILPDVSGSIDRESLEQAFKAIDELTGHLQRGDRLTIIPILGDAEAEASGKILRFEVPASRQAYDTDLLDFQSKLSASLKEMRAKAIAHPGSKTDILGAVALAKQEFNLHTDHSTNLLAILSDFIEEDTSFNFKTDKRLGKKTTADNFAIETAKSSALAMQGISIYLGLLQSQEYLAMAPIRRNAIKEFWIKYFQYSGSRAQFIVDGPGALGFISNR